MGLLVLGGCALEQPAWLNPIMGEKSKQMTPKGRRVPVMNPGGYYVAPASSAHAPAAPPAAYPPLPSAGPSQGQPLQPSAKPHSSDVPQGKKEDGWFEWMKKPSEPEASREPDLREEAQRMHSQRKPLPGNVAAEQTRLAEVKPEPAVSAVAVVEKPAVADVVEPVQAEPTRLVAQASEPEAPAAVQVASDEIPKVPPTAIVEKTVPDKVKSVQIFSSFHADDVSAFWQHFRRWLTQDTAPAAEEIKITSIDLPPPQTEVPSALASSTGGEVANSEMAQTGPQPAPEPVSKPEILMPLLAAVDEYPELKSVPQKPEAFKHVLSDHPVQKKDLEVTRQETLSKKQALDNNPEPGSMLEEYKDGIPAPAKIPDPERSPEAETPQPPASNASPEPAAVVASEPKNEWVPALELASARLTSYTQPQERFLPESRYAQRRRAAAVVSSE